MRTYQLFQLRYGTDRWNNVTFEFDAQPTSVAADNDEDAIALAKQLGHKAPILQMEGVRHVPSHTGVDQFGKVGAVR